MIFFLFPLLAFLVAAFVFGFWIAVDLAIIGMCLAVLCDCNCSHPPQSR